VKQTSVALALFMIMQMGVPAALVYADGNTGNNVTALSQDVLNQAAAALASYSRDFNDGDISGWNAVKGTTTFSADNGTLKAVTTGAVVFVDQKSPVVKNGDYEIKMRFKDVPSRFGLVIRYVDTNNYAVIQFDNGTWGWDYMKNGTETYGNIETLTNPSFEANKEYSFKLSYFDDSVKLTLDDNVILNTTLPSIPMSAGKIGVRSWFANKTINIDDVKVNERTIADDHARPITLVDTLTSDLLTAEIDQEFPRVKKYVWSGTGAEMLGQILGPNEVKINGNSYYPLASKYEKHPASATKGETSTYTLQIPELNVDLDVELELKENVLNFRVTRIAENGTAKVNTVEFPTTI
jgi:endo-alpha-N-acetylgalactosaminidase